jgi:hypothetical protein
MKVRTSLFASCVGGLLMLTACSTNPMKGEGGAADAKTPDEQAPAPAVDQSQKSADADQDAATHRAGVNARDHEVVAVDPCVLPAEISQALYGDQAGRGLGLSWGGDQGGGDAGVPDLGSFNLGECEDLLPFKDQATYGFAVLNKIDGELDTVQFSFYGVIDGQFNPGIGANHAACLASAAQINAQLKADEKEVVCFRLQRGQDGKLAGLE